MAIKITKEQFAQKFGQGMPAPMAQPAQQSGINLGIADAFKGGVAQVKEGYNQSKNATNPIQLLEGGAKAAAGGFNAAFSPLAPVFKPLEMGINAVANKVSDNPSVQNFAMSPAGQTTARVAEDVGNLNTIAQGVIGAKAPIKAAGKVIEASKPAIAGTGRVLKAAGEGSYGITTNPSEATSRAMQTYKESSPNLVSRIKNTVTGNTKGKPITESNTAARYGLIGTEKEIGVQAGRYMKDVFKNKIDPALKQTKGKLDMKKFFDVVQNEIKTSTAELSRRSDLLEGLDALRSQYGKVGKVSLRKLQDYKSGWAQTLPESSFKGKPIAGALKEVKKIASDKARDFIYENAPESIKQDYIDYGNLKSIREAGIKSDIGDIANKSGFRVGWEMVMDKAVTPVATTMGKILYKTGEGLEFIGDSGAKTVGDIVGRDVPSAPIPNKESGFVNFDAIAKSIDNTDKSIMLDFLEGKNKAKATDLANAMGLESAFKGDQSLKNDFTKILDAERKRLKKNPKYSSPK